jgi:hypothetical protein
VANLAYFCFRKGEDVDSPGALSFTIGIKFKQINYDTMKKILLTFALVGVLSACCSDNKCGAGTSTEATPAATQACKAECDTLKQDCTGECANCTTGCEGEASCAH